jgi:hypothetical protein
MGSKEKLRRGRSPSGKREEPGPPSRSHFSSCASRTANPIKSCLRISDLSSPMPILNMKGPACSKPSGSLTAGLSATPRKPCLFTISSTSILERSRPPDADARHARGQFENSPAGGGFRDSGHPLLCRRRRCCFFRKLALQQKLPEFRATIGNLGFIVRAPSPPCREKTEI